MSDPTCLTQNLDVKVDKWMDKRMNRVTDKQTNECVEDLDFIPLKFMFFLYYITF